MTQRLVREQCRFGELRSIELKLVEVLGHLPFDLSAFEITPAPKVLKTIEDTIDAVTSAWVGGQYLCGHALAFGDATGAVWCPTRQSTAAF